MKGYKGAQKEEEILQNITITEDIELGNVGDEFTLPKLGDGYM